MSVLSMAVALYFGGVSFGILGDFVRRNEVWAERQYGLVFLITGGAILYGAPPTPQDEGRGISSLIAGDDFLTITA